MGIKNQFIKEFSEYQHSFSINSNNLIPLNIIIKIIKAYPSSLLKQLEGVITEICILVGGYQRQYYIAPDKEIKYKEEERFLYSRDYLELGIKSNIDNARILHSPYKLINTMNPKLHKNNDIVQILGYHEFNVESRVLYFYIYKVFNDGINQWEKFRTVGAIRRKIFQQLYYQLLKCLIKVGNIRDYFNFQSLFLRGDQVKVLVFNKNLIKISEKLFQKEEIPSKMGFLDYLYYRYMDLKGVRLGGIDNIRRYTTKFFNEMRRLKFKYKYEHTLSELIHYCLHKRPFKKYIEANYWLRRKKWYKNPLYFQCKQIVSKYLNNEGISESLIEYQDSAKRKTLFLTHDFFESVKKACLQKCIEKVSYPELLLYNKFIEMFSICPKCTSRNIITELNSYFFNKANIENLRKSDQLQSLKGLKILCSNCS